LAPLSLARHWKQGWLAALSAVAVVCLLETGTSFLAPLQRNLSDWATSAVPPPTVAAPVSLVEIDDASLIALGPWPWPRELQARLIDRLSAANAAVVAYSIPWIGPEPSEALNQLHRLAATVAADPTLAEHAQLAGWMQQSQVLLDGDSRLAQSLAQNKHTILAVGPQLSAGAGWPLASLVNAAAGVGAISVAADPDGLLRAVPLIEQRAQRQLPSLPLASVAQWRGVSLNQLQWSADRPPSRKAQLGPDLWPVDAQGRVHPVWTHMNHSPAWIQRWSAAEVLAGRVPPRQLAGKLVIVALAATDTVTSLHAANGIELTPGQAMAQTAAALAGGRLIAQPAWAQLVKGGMVLSLCLYLALLLPRLTHPSALAMSLLLGILLVAGSHLCVAQLLIEIPVALPLTVLAAGHLAGYWVRRSTAPALALPMSARPASMPPAPGFSQPEPTSPATLPPAQVPAPVLGSATRPADGLTVGDFLLQQEIGRGAMGRVFRARQISTGQVVAVKTLALAREFDGFALLEARQRFQREAIAASRLRHPDIVRILDTGEDMGRVWIAMELLHGNDLVHHTSDGKLLPVPRVLEICARIAVALGHAHAQGVVHRDIKPANVMVDFSDSAAGHYAVKVTDFGIARITDAARTRTGLVLGSPSYMSPEHLAGRAVDGRSDLYSLGVLMFQMLTGQLPFQGSTVAELMHAVANTPAPDVRTLRPRLPEAVANIVALALEKRPELRYADGSQFAADLRCIAALWDHRSHAPNTGLAEPATRWSPTAA
jgi:eukaryotic-like serine/threonine-protein kinase